MFLRLRFDTRIAGVTERKLHALFLWGSERLDCSGGHYIATVCIWMAKLRLTEPAAERSLPPRAARCFLGVDSPNARFRSV